MALSVPVAGVILLVPRLVA
jgi:hypothetical protein